MTTKQKDIRMRSNEELEAQIQTLKEYYWVKSKSWAIKKAIKDCATVAEHKNIPEVKYVDKWKIIEISTLEYKKNISTWTNTINQYIEPLT